ncbi:hypothetical protein IEQ34_007192 [Dendrobium chrysotoxum]|uniref:Uncharacterized protein n=1 Tax=Dendrobium chrysotoxum TaxID=161865 RepID=A0AAV7H751_DENCH|nr:hypothetical protein IEQ34_007192 [Dendrobium chrysotoxum]
MALVTELTVTDTDTDTENIVYLIDGANQQLGRAIPAFRGHGLLVQEFLQVFHLAWHFALFSALEPSAGWFIMAMPSSSNPWGNASEQVQAWRLKVKKLLPGPSKTCRAVHLQVLMVFKGVPTVLLSDDEALMLASFFNLH